MMYFLTVFGTFILPFIFAYGYWKKKTYWHSFYLGVFCFFITQMVARPIFLKTMGYFYSPMQQIFESIPTIIIAASSAGIFEEVGRYLFWKKFRKDRKPTFQDALAFGIGHAGLEAAAGVGLRQLLSWQDLYYMDITIANMIYPLNRIIAGVGHVALTMIVFYGLRSNKRPKFFVFIAIVVHFLLDLIGGMIISLYDYEKTLWGFSWSIEHQDAFTILYMLFSVISTSAIIYLAYRGFSKIKESESNQNLEVL